MYVLREIVGLGSIHSMEWREEPDADIPELYSNMAESSGICGHSRLQYDEACLHISNLSPYSTKTSNVSSMCYLCDPQPFLYLASGGSQSVVMSSVFPTVIKLQVNSKIHQDVYNLGQHGHYKLLINEAEDVQFSVLSPATDAYAPLWYLLATLVAGVGLCWVARCVRNSNCWKRYVPAGSNVVIRTSRDDSRHVSVDENSPTGDSSPLVPHPPPVRQPNRTGSLDVFRGLTVTLMMFVNYGGGNYAIFEHSPWNGLTFADIVFPWFAWIMGFGLALSIQSQLRNAVLRSRVCGKVVTRGAILIALGIVLNSFGQNYLHQLRIPGVLQRLGLSLIIVGAVESMVMIPQHLATNLENRFVRCRLLLNRWGLDLMYGWNEILFILVLVALHTATIFFVPVQGCPTGYLGPGGLHLSGKVANCTGGITGYIDRLAFGQQHIYQRPTSFKVYRTRVPFDPEGLLGTLMTCVNLLFGVTAGRIIVQHSSASVRTKQFIIYAGFTGIVAGLLTSFSVEGGIIPMNKNLWSLSFALATTSLAFTFFTFLYFLVDVQRVWTGFPFKQVGRNAIVLYFGHIITKQTFPWNWSPVDMTDHSTILWMNLWSTTLWIIVAVIMDSLNMHISL